MYSTKMVLPSLSGDVDVTELIDPVAVVHRGRVILFSRSRGEATASLYYNIRLDAVDGQGGAPDWSGWRSLSLDQVDRQQLLRVSGMGLITVPPLVTSAAPADAPFRVVADRRFVYLYRQSSEGTLYVNRLVMVEEPAQQNLEQRREEGQGGTQVGFRLDFLWEVRYRRSRKKDTPADDKDTLGNRDMDGRLFYEPTLELTAVKGVTEGNFAVVLGPTADAERGRWHVFVRDPDGSKVTASSFAQSSSGLFDFVTAKTAPFDITPHLDAGSGSPVAMTCTFGPAASLYYDQEPMDNDEAEQTLRRGARLALAVPVSAASAGLTAASAVFDFGILSDGTIPTFDGRTAGKLIDGSIEGGKFRPDRSPGAGYPVPDDAVHALGDSTVAAVVLGQAAASAVPAFLDSGDGLLRYYFAGPPDAESKTPFLVAQYSPLTTRFAVAHDWVADSESGKLQFLAERAGTSMNAMSVAIAAAGGPGESDLCGIQVDYGNSASIPSEVWSGVPRSLEAAIAVLNGSASPDPEDPGVRAGQTVFFDYTGTRKIARLPLDDETAPSGHAMLVSRRSDLDFLSAEATAAGEGAGEGSMSLALTFAAGDHSLTWTWGALPGTAAEFASTLRGDASPRRYDYRVAAGDPQVFVAQTDGGAILFLADPGSLAEGAKITVENDGLEEERLCKVKIDTGSGAPIEIGRVPRKQSDFINTLNADPQVAAIFLHISADPVSGLVVNQSSTVGDLRDVALALSVVDQGAGGTVVPTSDAVAATVLQSHVVTPTRARPVNRLVAAKAVALTRPDNGVTALLQDSGGTPGTPAHNGLWKWQPQPRALDFNRENAMSVALGTTASPVLRPHRFFAAEAWVRPSVSGPTRVLCYNDGDAETPTGTVPSYMLGTTGRPAIAFGASTSSQAYDGSYIKIEANDKFRLENAFTCSGWIKPMADPAPSGGFGVLFALEIDPRNPAVILMLGLDHARRLVFGYRDKDYQFRTFVEGHRSVPSDTWSYVTAAGKREEDGSWTVVLYVDAVPGSPHSGLWFDEEGEEPPVGYIGIDAPKSRSLAGSISEVRFWRTYRSQAEIQRTMRMTLSGSEAGLTGYWPLVEDPVDHAVIHNRATGSDPESGPDRALDGKVHRRDSKQPMSQSKDGTFLSILGGVGGVPAVVGQGFLVSDRWNHIAVAFEAGTAIHLNPDGSFAQGRLDHVNCGNPDTLNLSNTGSVEAFILMPGSNRQNNTILSKWGAEKEQRSYKLYVDDSKKLAFTAVVMKPVYGDEENPDFPTGEEPMNLTVTSQTPLDDQHHHVVGVYSTESFIVNKDDETPKLRGVMKVFVDGEEVGSKHTKWYPNATTIAIRATNADFVIGAQMLQGDQSAAVAVETQEYFHGILTGVRVWADALDKQRIGGIARTRQTDATGGLTSAWWFGEQVGLDAADSIAGNDARLSSADLWVLYRPLSRVTCYANGYEVGLYDPATPEEALGYDNGQVQFTAGAYIEGPDYKVGLEGAVQELRLWSMAQSVEEFRENMFRSLTGAERNLIGYWPLNGNAEDATVYGNHGRLVGRTPPDFVASKAPVSNEAPPVRNVYSDHTTEFQEALDGTASVVEYGDAKRQADGTLTAIQDRDYFYVNQTLALTPDFKVGDLELIHLGQVQTSPTLIGFIEGAPPVPSENLSRPLYESAFAYNGYFDATSISLSQSESKTFSFAVQDSNSTEMRNSSSVIGFFGMWDVGVSSGTPFFSLDKNQFRNSVYVGRKVQYNRLQTEDDSQLMSSGWTNLIQDRFGLRGRWEPAQAETANYLNPQVGRRFEPDNLGYALVESLTADLYSMQLASTGRMIGKIVLPNPEIPKDRNIITFRINPRYVKNGTLDGKVGLYDDPDWIGADRERGSYFRPKEAYALKQEINEETKKLRIFHEQFGASSRGRSGNTDLEDAKPEQFYDWDQGDIRKGLVNSYVWTASGGLHSEEQQVSALRETSFSGTYHLTKLAGVSAQAELAIFAIGVYGGIDLLFGHQTDVTVGKTETEAYSFGMNAAVTGDPFLSAWDPEAEAYTDAPCPGKVDAYRFMTFYLPPNAKNAESFLEEVIDEDWLRHSADPNAIALRGAVIEGNKAWRILHRVTYVSRIPPAFDTAPSQRVSRKVEQSIVVADNQLLIAMVQRELGGDAPTPARLGAAITAVLAPASGDALLSAVLPWWQGFLERTRGPSPDEEAQRKMAQLRFDTLHYMLRGYELGLLPLRN